MSRPEPLNDFDERAVAAAEADLQRLLSIEPSPEFAAKVRARVAEEATKRARGWGWIGLVATVAAAVVVVAVLRSGLRTGDEQRPFSTPTQSDIVLSVERVNPPNPIAPVAPATKAGTAQIRRASVPSLQTEIIIDPAISDAIRRLALAARNTTLDSSKGESIAAPNSESDTLPVAEQLNIPELVLTPADRNGGQ